jgi:hypothetical protein
VSSCLQLKTEVDSFAKLAVANNKATKQSKKSKKSKKNKKRALKNVIRKTIVLACGSTFECTDASAPAEKQDITLKMMGAGELTIRAADGCATGDARPRLFGGRDTYPSEIFYVGAANPNNAADKGGVAFLVLENIIVDGAVTRDGATTPENLRAGLYAVRAAGVTLNNVDFLNTQAKSSYGGGAIYVEDAPLAYTGGQVKGAVSAGNGGAIWAETSAGGEEALVIKDVTFTGNNARYGAGTIAFTKSGSAAAKATISAVFSGNKAAKCAVLFTDRSDVARSQKSKQEDKAGDALTVDFTGSTFTDNVAENKLSFCGAAVEPFAPASITGAPGSSSGKVGSYNDYAM